MNALATINASNARLPQVYIATDGRGRVKIGFSTDIAARMKQLNSGNAEKVSVIRTFDGGARTEKWLHQRFAASAIKGEWFAFDPAMLTIIPPDEVPSRRAVTIRRDVGLTLRERLRDAVRIGDEMGLPSREVLLTFIPLLNDTEAQELLDIIASGIAARVEAA